MIFFKRAILSIKSRFSKTLLLFTVMTTICLLILCGISIQTASVNAGVLARQKLGAQVTLKVDTEKMRENMMNARNSSTSSEQPSGERMKPTMTPLPTEYIDELKISEYVESYLAQSSTSMLANDFTAVGSSDEDSEATESNLILADEATGNLDEDTSNEIISIFENLVKENNKTVILVTHNNDIAKRSDITYVVKNKKLLQSAVC